MRTEMASTACQSTAIRKSAFSLLGLLALLPLSALRAETLDELYKKAKVEGAGLLHRRGCGRSESDSGGFREAISGHNRHGERRLQ